MPSLHHSFAALRIGGDSLKPDEISRILGCSPTLSCVKGQIEPSKGKTIVRETGGWHLDAIGQQPGDVNAHVAQLFRQVNNDVSAWAALSGEYETDLFCVYFMSEADEGLEVATETLKVLGDRGIKLELRIYSPAKENDI
jgi:Domain of unknown function (DUF4279)